jgi:hypothetical protein
MTDREELHKVLRSIVRQAGIRGAFLVTFEGEVLAFDHPAPTADAAPDNEWARAQAALIVSYRRQVHQRDFSVLLDDSGRQAHSHFHVRQVGDYLLGVCFDDRHARGDAQRLSRDSAPLLEQLLDSRHPRSVASGPTIG